MQDDWEEKEIELEDDAPPDEVLDRLEAPETSRLPWMMWGLAVVVIGVALFWYLTNRGSAPTTSPAPVATSEGHPAAPESAETEAPKDIPAIELPALSASDGLFREMVSTLSSQPLLASLLVPDDLIRKLVVIVANVSNGESPARQLSHVRPEERFAVLPAPGGRTVIDPESYHRYDVYADLFVSLDDDGMVKLYRIFRPLLEEAHAELGLADRRDFEDTLSRAVEVLLAAPVMDRPVGVRGVSVNYAFEDPALERLSPPQKHLLRMGPDNTRRIQKKITELAAAIGIDRRAAPQE
jgi:Protein of unknown function (DUF3014)